MQETDEIKLRVSYTSNKLLPRETRYSVIDRGYVAYVCEKKKFLSYSHGKKFQIGNDGRVMRWVLNLILYPFRFTAIKGSQNIRTDYMSRTEK